MRASSNRARRYRAKIDGEVIGNRFSAEKADMVKHQMPVFANAVKIEQTVKSILPGVKSLDIVYYIVFAKEIAKVLSKHSGDTALREIGGLQVKWSGRGLNSDNLDRIKGIFLAPYIEAKIFKLDYSYLDGEDLLA